MNTIIKSYQLKNGETRYMFRINHGINSSTGKFHRTSRRSFKSKWEAEQALKTELENKTTARKRHFSNRHYTREEMINFLEMTKNESSKIYYTFFRLLAYSGIRVNEANALTWENINFEDNTILINKSVSYSAGNEIYPRPLSSDNWRTIKIDTQTMQILKEWREEQVKQLQHKGIEAKHQLQPVFSSSQNALLNPSQSRLWLNRISEKHNLKPIVTHTFRHAHAAILTESEANPAGIQQRLGYPKRNATVTENVKQETLDKFLDYMDDERNN